MLFPESLQPRPLPSPVQGAGPGAPHPRPAALPRPGAPSAAQILGSLPWRFPPPRSHYRHYTRGLVFGVTAVPPEPAASLLAGLSRAGREAQTRPHLKVPTLPGGSHSPDFG